MLARGQKASNAVGPKCVAWIYVGSANLSESAWGKQSTKGDKLNCRNWECGVLYPVPSEMSNSPSGRQEQGELGIDVFWGYITIPFEIPASTYGNKRPWFFLERS
jgi:hypothetical protein